MKKLLFITVICFSSSRLLAQTNETVTEESLSAWIKVESPLKIATAPRPQPVKTVKKKPNVPKKKVEPASTAAPAAKPPNSFDKTNSKVKRFKKG
jgi:hypothetical protein